MKASTTFTKLLLIAVVTGVATTGCATKGDPLSRGVAPDEQTALSIRNNSWSDMKIYLVPASGGRPVRIGTVGSLATDRIRLRGRIKAELQTQGSLRFLIEPLGNPRESYTTHSVFMTPGDVMHLTVANHLRNSTLVVRAGS